MYNDEYYVIDINITDRNVGARKERSVRDKIFVIYAISNSVINGRSPSIQVEVIDVKTCFDKMWLEACINAIHEGGVQKDHLNLLYIENKNAQIAVKINGKTSRRVNVRNVIMQGSVWGSLKCTTQMDKLNKICKEKNSLQYHYKRDTNITIGVLGMVDDTLVPAECGVKYVEKNSVVNSFIESHRLKLHEDKS
jgi:Pyruvate/2-oxoacid:ferredoxin oxidoreductase gamma subunit